MKRCLNCKANLRGPFCCDCGQKALALKIPFYKTLGTILSEAMTLDSRTWRTVMPFLIWPGKLTHDYNRGRRVRYTSPLRLYLLMSLLLFVTVGFMSQLGALGVYETALPSSRADAVELKTAVEDLATQALDDSGPETDVALPAWLHVAPDSLLGQAIARQLVQLEDMDDETRTAAILAKAMGMLPTLMFFLMPLLALSLRFFFIGTSFVYTEHLVFSLHMHAYAYLLFFVGLLANEMIVAQLVAIVTTVYYFAALQKAYGCMWVMTLLRGGLALITYWVVLMLGMAGALAFSALQV